MVGGMCGGGHAWWGGGMHGRGACVVVGRHAWQGGHASQGGVHGRYYKIRSMSWRYASYWNAFLFEHVFVDDYSFAEN